MADFFPMPVATAKPAAQHIEDIDGTQYRFTRWGKRWVVHLRCECIMGPHWHETVWYGREIKTLRQRIRAEQS